MKTKQEKWKTCEEKEEDDPSIAPLMEMFHCVESNDDSSSKGKKREEKECGSSTLSKTKHCVMNKMASGSKDMCIRSAEKEMTTQKTKKLHSSYCKKR